MAEEEGAAAASHSVGGEVNRPIRQVVLISAGASHSVALLCKFKFVGFVYSAFFTFLVLGKSEDFGL